MVDRPKKAFDSSALRGANKEALRSQVTLRAALTQSGKKAARSVELKRKRHQVKQEFETA